MRQTLQLKNAQQLAMTPQLQQAIRLLQLSSLDLQQEIQEALDSNMMLEVEESEQTENIEPTKDAEEPGIEIEANVDFEENQMDIPNEIEADFSWDEVFQGNSAQINQSASKPFEGESDIFENYHHAEQSIQEHLMWQIEMANLSEIDKQIAETIVDSIDDNGFLSVELEQLLEGFQDQEGIGIEEMMAVLHFVQSLDPIGIGARNLSESLTIQLNALDDDTENKDDAKLLVGRYMDVLASRDFAMLKRRSRLSEDALRDALQLIKSLNPRPAGQLGHEQTQYVAPDIIVKKINNIWRAELNYANLPSLTVSQEYVQIMRDVKTAGDNEMLKEHLQEAKWFIKSIEQRNDTLLKVARCILDFQIDFFNYGEEYMKALVLSDVAEKVGMHESTISRVTTQKYMHTPMGVFELKYFFSSHVSTTSGGEVSATAIRAMIKKLIELESSAKPYSDSKLSQLLAEKNYKVARRTVAKYREAMSIPPSSQRKMLV